MYRYWEEIPADRDSPDGSMAVLHHHPGVHHRINGDGELVPIFICRQNRECVYENRNHTCRHKKIFHPTLVEQLEAHGWKDVEDAYHQ